MADGSDFEHYLAARWPDLVGGLEDEGVPADDARLAVAETLLASRRSWSRRVRDEQVDVSLWAELRERTDLPARPGEEAPHGVRRSDPADGPDPWLARAEAARAVRRRRSTRRGFLACACLLVLATGWAWWAARPEPREVVREDNPLPLIWYAEGRLHLQEVVVDIPDIDEFVAWGSGAAATLRSGEVVGIDADGDVHQLDRRPATLIVPPGQPYYLPIGEYDVLVQSAPVPGGGWAHLLDSSRRASVQDDVRQSESGRRALVVCTADDVCGEPRTIVEADGSIRLR
ncbi:hypothetical protein J2X46_004195 [Nocardioides sp. BE266]|uniref:hypothetical protein n=1 Tax=Nocardioides sp. BE266 TaxID=2817725 RepID=UPI0028675F55|nr:hypothetical protein [Nocardioides sp. BE266]MDR7255193.1 hypothetical protein [Nocardioides sp. BE266]